MTWSIIEEIPKLLLNADILVIDVGSKISTWRIQKQWLWCREDLLLDLLMSDLAEILCGFSGQWNKRHPRPKKNILNLQEYKQKL